MKPPDYVEDPYEMKLEGWRLLGWAVTSCAVRGFGLGLGSSSGNQRLRANDHPSL